VDADLVKSFAQRLGLDWERLQRDMADPAIQARLDANLKLAHVLGIQGTPAYVIGDQLLPGAVGLDDLQQVIALARKS
jgi:protein-disulfide isomerase